MTRKIGDKLVIASHNAGKIREIGALMAPYGIAVVSAKELGLEEPAETEDSFAGNARIKAHAAAKAAGLPALSDDSGIMVDALDGAPGVYVDGAKIGALGLRVRNGCSYHGLSLNVDMDLAPFTIINPCGYSGLETVQLRQFGVTDSVAQVGERLLAHLERLMPPITRGIRAH